MESYQMNNRLQNSAINGGSNQQNISEDVIKFLLKLKNNNIQNLKNALRKLGEKT